VNIAGHSSVIKTYGCTFIVRRLKYPILGSVSITVMITIVIDSSQCHEKEMAIEYMITGRFCRSEISLFPAVGIIRCNDEDSHRIPLER